MHKYGVYAARAAAYLGISRDRLAYYIRQKGAPDASTRHGRKKVFTPADLEALGNWLNTYRQQRHSSSPNASVREGGSNVN